MIWSVSHLARGTGLEQIEIQAGISTTTNVVLEHKPLLELDGEIILEFILSYWAGFYRISF